MCRMTLRGVPEMDLSTSERRAAYAGVLKQGNVKTSGALPLWIKRRRLLLLTERLLQW
jgi:hypothetical protein